MCFLWSVGSAAVTVQIKSLSSRCPRECEREVQIVEGGCDVVWDGQGALALSHSVVFLFFFN